MRYVEVLLHLLLLCLHHLVQQQVKVLHSVPANLLSFLIMLHDSDLLLYQVHEVGKGDAGVLHGLLALIVHAFQQLLPFQPAQVHLVLV